MANNYKILDWDSDFFGYKVARILSPEPNEYNPEKTLKELQKLGVTLVYFPSSKMIDNQSELLERYSGKLVDKKITFVKKITGDTTTHPLIQEYTKDYTEPKLYLLALESGIYSRFKVDERIGKDNFERLYKKWIDNSVAKIIARAILVYIVHDEIQGMITLGEKNRRGDLGIAAVDRNARGKGIGKALVNSADDWFSKNGFNTVQVVTQGANLSACKLYDNCGYKIEKTEYFYHFWLNDKK